MATLKNLSYQYLLKKPIKRLANLLGYQIHIYRSKPRAAHQQMIDVENLPRKINYGCGPELHSGWLNVDLNPSSKPGVSTLSIDLTREHPFPDNFFNFAYSQDFIEHLSQANTLLFFVEVYRTMKLDGVFRLSFPSLEGALRDFSVSKYQRYSEQKINHFDKWGHEHLYSKDEIKYVLEHIGFTNVCFVDYGKSSYSELIGLDTRTEQIGMNIYIEAAK